jgi:hypothetical protein
VIEALLAICPNEPPLSGSLSQVAPSGWSVVSEHIGSLISSTLRNAIIRPGQVSSVVSPMCAIFSFVRPSPRGLIQYDTEKRLRIASLQLLGALAMTIQYDKVHPFKVNVIRELQKALDDPKRAVRREAVEARCVPGFDHVGA